MGQALWEILGPARRHLAFCCTLAALVLLAPVGSLEARGSIRDLQIKPPSCHLQPGFAPRTTFYVVDCPEQVTEIGLEAETVFPLFADGVLVKQPRILRKLGAGHATVLALKACTTATAAGDGCRHYSLDLHRQGSSEALLAELLVTSGGTDVPLSPPFHPSVSSYRANVPSESALTQVVASAAKGGFVSFAAFASADQHSQSRDVAVPTASGSEQSWKALTSLQVFVVSADWTGKMRYEVQFGRAPSSDAKLAALASNVGAPYPVGKQRGGGGGGGGGGAPLEEAGDEAFEGFFLLAVPRGTREVALSATAADKDGAKVLLAGNHGQGYASAVLQLDPEAPYKRVKIRVKAADEVTVNQYLLVVAMTNHRTWAMLESLVVPGCEGGLRPKFETDVFRYQCLLPNQAEAIKVLPSLISAVPGDAPLQLRVQGKEWKSGNVFVQPLRDDGNAEVDITVQASDGKHQATYSLLAQGSPLAERGRLFTTEEPKEPSPVTPPPAHRYGYTAPPQSRANSTTTRATTTAAVRLRPSTSPAAEPQGPVPMAPSLPEFRIQLPGLHPATPGLPSASTFARSAAVLAASASMAALLASHELGSFILLLKELQFVAVSGEFAGDSYYALMTTPFRVFLLQVDWGLDVCVEIQDERCSPLHQKAAQVQTAMLGLALLPLLLVLLALGWLRASYEEGLAKKSLLAGLGVRGLRVKLLPLVLALLDVGLVGFADGSAALLSLPDARLKAELGGHSLRLSTSMARRLTVSFLLVFCFFSFLQLLRLQMQRLLSWSPLLGRFADTTALAVTLRDSVYMRPAATPWAALAEACDSLTELRAAVPICGPDRDVIRLTDASRFGSLRRAPRWEGCDGCIFTDRRQRVQRDDDSRRLDSSRSGIKQWEGYKGCFFAVLPPEEALLAREPQIGTQHRPSPAREVLRSNAEETETLGCSPMRKLLGEGSGGAAAWQLHREYLGLLIWMERRCNTYDALTVQINEAVGHGVITDAEGWPIYDCQGQPLRDLYQYLIYQFPWRPWLRTMEGTSSGCSLAGAREPYRKATGVLAPWVPTAAGIQDLERQQINDWLSEWLVESEAASAAREELRQLRWYSQELQWQHSVLLEMALAVLERRNFHAPSGTPREARLSQQRLEDLTEQPPWQQQVDGLGSHEILAFVHEDLMDSDDMPFYDEELVPDFLDATFGVIRFHVRSPGENPNPAAQPEPPKRPPIRVSESLSPRRPPPRRVQHSVRRMQVREGLVTARLPLKYLDLMVRWLPTFGFIVQAQSLALPVAECWLPLFPSFSSCPKCRGCPAAQTTSSNALQLPSWALYLDSFERALAVLCIYCVHLDVDRGLAGLLWPLLLWLLRFRCSGVRMLPASHAFEVAANCREPGAFGCQTLVSQSNLPWLQLALGLGLFLRAWLARTMDALCVCLLLWPSLLRALSICRLLWQSWSARPRSAGWSRGWLSLYLSHEWKQQTGLIVLGAPANSPHGDHPYPDFGIVQAVDKSALSGEAPPLLFVSRMLGLQLQAMQSLDIGGGFNGTSEGHSTNQRRVAGLRKLLVLFEPCPPGLTDARPRSQDQGGQGQEGSQGGASSARLRDLRGSSRFKEVREVIPICATRQQLIGAEELPSLVCSIQVVNHLGRPWSSSKHDSFLSLFLPWGLDSRKLAATSQPSQQIDGQKSEDGQWRHWRNETFESTKLVTTWQSKLVSWLDEELAAGSLVGHGILDLMFFARNPDRGAFKEEVDKLLVPGIFSDDCLGTKRFCDSRCFREGRVLHYVIASTDLKPRRAWRPDPLGAHAASLFLSSNSSSCSSLSPSERSGSEEVNFWRPCLLRLNSRQVTYVLRKCDEVPGLLGWSEPVARDHGDAYEYRIPFVFLDRIEVSRGLRGREDEECLLTLHGLTSTPTSSIATPSPRAEDLAMANSANPLTLTPEPLPSPRSRGGSPRASPRVSPRGTGISPKPSLPLVFRVSKADGEVWAKVIEEYGMFTPPLHILHYIGDVADHPRLPGIVYRHGDGDQLWPDGTRYIGAWENHAYHGSGQLLDPEGQIIYKGQWAQGMKHGEGFYRFFQEPSGSRAYSGQFQREEFSGHGILWVVEEDGSLEWVQKHRPWAITRYEGLFSGGSSDFREPRSLILVDEGDSVALQEHFPVLQNEAGVGPHQGPGKAPKDMAAETYGLDAADLQHCGPDQDAEIWYADGTRYHGPCLAGAVPHGERGSLWEEAGLCFEGGFRLGLRAPEGRVSLPNGVIYEGSFSVGGQRHGAGATSIPGPLQRRLGFSSYVGEYHQGLRHGQGEVVFADGTVYRGKFQKNRRHGHGHYRNHDGTPIYTGPWKNDEPGTGYADILYPSGHRYKGNVCDGCRDGKGSLWHQDPDGDSTFLYRGHWQADEMHGEGELHCTDGVYRGQFVNGLREGKGRFEYARSADTLSYYEGEWEEDQPHGAGTFVDEYGHEYADREFEQGDLIGSRLTTRSKHIFSVKTISSVSLSMGKQRPSSSKVLPGPKKEIPHTGTVCQNAGLLPEEEPALTRAIDVGSGISHARSRPAHCGPEDSIGLRWA